MLLARRLAIKRKHIQDSINDEPLSKSYNVLWQSTKIESVEIIKMAKRARAHWRVTALFLSTVYN